MAINLDNGEPVALKKMKKKTILEKRLGKECLINQMRLFSELNHPNIIKVYEMFESTKSITFVMELVPDTSLTKSASDTRLGAPDIINIMKGLLSGLSYLHSHNIMHRNIKMDNILTSTSHNGTDQIKITGFSMAAKLKEQTYIQKCGTPGYIAPEIFSGKPYDCLCDIFAAGVVFHILYNAFHNHS